MAVIIKAKNKDFLRQSLATQQRNYDILYRAAANDYAFSMFMQGYAGWLEHKWVEAHKESRLIK